MSQVGSLPASDPRSPGANRAPAGPVPPGIGTGTPTWFSTQILTALGAPLTPGNVAALNAWQQAEGQWGAGGEWNAANNFNPLNIEAGGQTHDAGGGNNISIWSDWQTGIANTVAYMNSHTPGIIATLKNGTDPAGLSAEVTASHWGTQPFGGSTGQVTVNAGAADPASGVGGASGQTPTVANGPVFDPNVTQPDNPTLDQEITTQFPDFAWAMSDPQIANILRFAAANNEAAAWVTAQIQQTNWWKQNSDSIKQFQTLQNTDPAEALQQMHNRAATLVQQGSVIGLNISPDRANQLATEALKFNWNDQQTQQALYAEYKRVSAPTNAPTLMAPAGPNAMGVTANLPAGTAGNYAQQAIQAAHEYLTTLTPQQANDLGMKIATGQMDPSALNAMFVGQAKARFKDNPDLMQALDAGITPSQVLAPYQSSIANLLEISPDQVNFSDPKYAAILSTTDSRGTNRLMTQTEANIWARSQPEWTQTQNAKQTYASTAQQLLSTLGEVKY